MAYAPATKSSRIYLAVTPRASQHGQLGWIASPVDLGQAPVGSDQGAPSGPSIARAPRPAPRNALVPANSGGTMPVLPGSAATVPPRVFCDDLGPTSWPGALD